MGEVVGPAGLRGEVSSGLGVGFGVSWDTSCWDWVSWHVSGPD